MHQIKRQIIEVQVHSGDGFSWQREVERLSTDRLPRRLEVLFDQYSPKDTILIDHLELDLGNLDEATFEEEFLKAIEKVLGERLSQMQTLTFGTRPLTPFATFLYFLKTGTLPWWVEAEVFRKFIREAESPESWNSYGTEQFVQLTETLRTTPPALRRLREQFSELFLIQLTLFLFQKKDPRIFIKWSSFQHILQSNRLFPTRVSARYFYGHLIENIIQSPDGAEDFFVKILHKTLTDTNLKAQLPATFSQTQWESFLKELQQKFGESFSLVTASPAEIEGTLENFSRDRVEEEKAIQEEGDQYYIANAGLVLLAPFLTEYLKNCKVADASRILDPDAAVHLIQYLATGQVATPEYELVLNKVLCGLPVHAPVADEMALSEAQQQEANDVLDSVLRYWPVMKNTSREGLQASFLQRPAKLSRRNNADSVSNAFSVHGVTWLLQVEQASYDLLLSELPWSYNPVALPWMPAPIWVEWS